MTRLCILITVCFSLLASAAFENHYGKIDDAEAEKVIQQAMEAHGGLENWQSIESLSFDKWYALYDAEGREEVNVDQSHQYSGGKVVMKWKDGEDRIEQIKTGEQFLKFRNGAVDESAKASSVKNSILASTFVMNIPYNLLDSGSEISYKGERTFMDRKVDIVRVEYFPATQAHHTTKDIWWHYFDKETHIELGYKVKHKDHISLVKNTSFHEVDGFTLPWKRESFRIDEDGNELYLRAEYEYSNYSIETSPKIRTDDLENLPGNWTGTLTYVDYSSGEPYTMPCNVYITERHKNQKYNFQYEYPNEPKANSNGVLKISKDAQQMDDRQIVSRTVSSDLVTIVTEHSGKDGNDNAKALIRNVYELGKESFIMRKEVRFEGKKDWLKRNEFSFTRMK